VTRALAAKEKAIAIAKANANTNAKAKAKTQPASDRSWAIRNNEKMTSHEHSP
jgi:hypothetical protein